VPVLCNIPVLGNLFRYQKTEKTKKNLMVFLTPTILRDGTEHATATDRRYQELQDIQMQRRAGGVSMMPDEKQPVMDDLLGLPPDIATGKR